MISEKNRNLNLFIGFNEEERNHYTSTFFLEQVRDRYKKREALDNKQKKHIQLLPDLKQLEREEIRLIYQPYVAEEIRIEILDALMEQENLLKICTKVILP